MSQMLIINPRKIGILLALLCAVFLCSPAWAQVQPGTTGVTAVGNNGNGVTITGNGSGPYTGKVGIGLNTPDHTYSANHTVGASDMAGTMNLTGTATLTIPAISSTVFAQGMTGCYVNQGSGVWTISSTPAINGLNSTSVPPGTGGCLVSNGTSLDWQPGAQPATGTQYGVVENPLTGTGAGSHGYVATQTLPASTGTITPQNPVGQQTNYAVVLTGNATIAVPTTVAVNQNVQFQITESSGGGNTLTFASGYTFLTGTPSFSTIASATNVVGCYATSSSTTGTGTFNCVYYSASGGGSTANALTGAGAGTNGYVATQILPASTGTITPQNPVGQQTNYAVTLTGNATIALPTTMAANQNMQFQITEPSGGGDTLAFASGYTFLTGTPSFNTGASAVNVVGCYAATTSAVYCAYYSSSGGSGITGTGTANSITKWTGTSALGNSTITDNGTVVNTTEPIEINGAKLPTLHAFAIGWVAGQNPQHAIVVADLPNAETITSIVGRLEVAEGSSGTVSVYSAPSGTACASGTNLTNTTSFNTNGTAATNQTLAGTTTSVAAGSSLCLVTTGTFTTNIATITIYAHPT
jgi:hypothetical protein